MSLAPLEDDGMGPVEIPLSSAPATVTSLGFVAPVQFEDTPVDTTIARITGTVTVELMGDEVLHIDDRVRLVGDYRVVAVNHSVNKKGELVREHRIAACDSLSFTPWDPSNPSDNGIVRAR